MEDEPLAQFRMNSQEKKTKKKKNKPQIKQTLQHRLTYTAVSQDLC